MKYQVLIEIEMIHNRVISSHLFHLYRLFSKEKLEPCGCCKVTLAY